MLFALNIRGDMCTSVASVHVPFFVFLIPRGGTGFSN